MGEMALFRHPKKVNQGRERSGQHALHLPWRDEGVEPVPGCVLPYLAIYILLSWVRYEI